MTAAIASLRERGMSLAAVTAAGSRWRIGLGRAGILWVAAMERHPEEWVQKILAGQTENNLENRNDAHLRI